MADDIMRIDSPGEEHLRTGLFVKVHTEGRDPSKWIEIPTTGVRGVIEGPNIDMTIAVLEQWESQGEQVISFVFDETRTTIFYTRHPETADVNTGPSFPGG